MYYRQAKICLIVFDLTVADALVNVKRWNKGIVFIVICRLVDVELRVLDVGLWEKNNEEKVVALVGNKLDMEEERKVSKEDAEKCAKELDAAYFETSAKLQTGK